MRLVAGLVLATSLVAPAAHAASARDAASTLERGMRIAAGAHTDYTALQTGKLTVSLRPSAKVIAVRKGLSESGYFLSTGGKLSVADHDRLNLVLSKDPGATRGAIVRTLRTSQLEARAEQKRIAAVQPEVQKLLSKAASSAGREQILLTRGSSTLSYRVGGSGPMLVVSKGYGEHAIFLGGDVKSGFSLDSAGREEVARLLLAR